MPFFSICIPTYNRADLLPVAIDSALAQTESDYEIVVVDNASTDDTPKILERYKDSRVRVVRNKETVGMWANHNISVEQAKAPWVVFLHSDDQLREDALSTLKNRIQTKYCDLVYPAKNVHHRYIKFGDLLLDGPTFIPSLLRWPAGTPSGAAYKKDLLTEVKFDETIVVSDLILLAEALQHGKRILISSDDTVKIGVGEFQYSSNWHKSGDYIKDVSKAFKRVIDVSGVLIGLEDEIDTWGNSEIANLLMKLIRLLEKKLAIARRFDYKKEKAYRHVSLFKVAGGRGLHIFYKVAKYVKNS